MFIDFRERDIDRDIFIDVRNISWLPGIYALTGNGTSNLLVHGTRLQPTGPPSQGWEEHFKRLASCIRVSPSTLFMAEETRNSGRQAFPFRLATAIR